MARSFPVTAVLLIVLAGFSGLATSAAEGTNAPSLPLVVSIAPESREACVDTTYEHLSSYDNVIQKYNSIVSDPRYANYVEMWSANQKYGYGPIPGVTGTYKDIYVIRLTNESRGLHKPEVLFAGPPHGDENIGVQVNVFFTHWLLKYALDPECRNMGLEASTESLNWLLDNREIYLTSSGNPYGYNSQRGDSKGRDLNREYDHTQCNVDGSGNKINCGPQAIGLIRSVNGAVVATFMQGHQIRTASDWHGGTFALMYSFGYAHQGVTASSRIQAGRSVDYAPADYHYLDNVAISRIGPFMGPNPNGASYTPSKIGTWYSQMSYNSGGIYMDGWYATDKAASPKETWVNCPGPTCNSSPTGLMKGSDCDPNGAGACKFDLGKIAGTTGWSGAGVMWYTPELGQKLVSNGWGSDRTNGWASYYRKYMLLITDLAEPSTRWWPGSPANNSQVAVNTPIEFKWAVNGSMVADGTQLFWAKNPDVINDPAKQSATEHVDFAGQDKGGTGWENPSNGKTTPHIWKDSVTFPTEGDWYVVARSKVDQVYGKSCTGTDPCGVIRPDIYGSDSYLKTIKQRTKPGWSQTIQGEDGPETMSYQEWWYSPTLRIKVGQDNSSPSVVLTNPADGAQNVAPNAQLVVTFSEAMDKPSAEAAFSLAPAATGTFTWDGPARVMTLKPSAGLANSTQYAATVSTGAKDPAGNAMTAPKVWKFTTSSEADVGPPYVVSTTPPAGAASVSVKSAITVQFNESMDRPTAESSFSLTPTAACTFSWPAPDRMVCTPGADLAELTTYTLKVAVGAKDLAGNQMSVAHSSVFTTGIKSGDSDPPRVIANSPLDQAVGVATNKKLVVTWSEPVLQTTAERTLSTSPATSGAFSWTSRNMTFTPASPLTPDTLYTVTVAPGAEDLAGNTMPGSHVFSFTTGAGSDTVPPTVVTVSPRDGAMGATPSTEIIFSFSEPIVAAMMEKDEQNGKYIGFDINPTPIKGKGTGLIDHMQEAKVVIYTPAGITIGSPGLADNTKYTVKVFKGLEDLTGNPMVDDFEWSFTTGFNSPVLAQLIEPVDDPKGVPTTTRIAVQFNKPMDKSSTEQAFKLEPAAPGTFAWDPQAQVMNYSATGGLKQGTEYVISLARTAKGANLQELGEDLSWTFTTAGTSPPPPGPGPAGDTGFAAFIGSPLGLGILLALALAIAGVAIFAARRNRRRKRTTMQQLPGYDQQWQQPWSQESDPHSHYPRP